MGDHSEAIEIAYDPTVISYQALVDVFFSAHRPSTWSSRQYRSAIFFHDDAQQKIAEAAASSRAITATGIEPAGVFTAAEDYHQKWYLRSGGPVWTEFEAMYPNTSDLVRSTAAARVNGWLGEGQRELTAAHLAEVGLSTSAGSALLKR